MQFYILIEQQLLLRFVFNLFKRGLKLKKILFDIIQLQLNKLDDCIKDCTKAIELDESYLKAYSRRAKSYMEKEDYEQAVIDYEKIYKLDKSKGKTIFYLNNKLYLTIYF